MWQEMRAIRLKTFIYRRGCQNSKLGSLDANSSSGKAGVELKHSAGPQKRGALGHGLVGLCLTPALAICTLHKWLVSD